MKLLAAHRAGLTHVAVPARNRKDIDELPEDIASAIRIDLVDNMDDVIAMVFPDGVGNSNLLLKGSGSVTHAASK